MDPDGGPEPTRQTGFVYVSGPTNVNSKRFHI